MRFVNFPHPRLSYSGCIAPRGTPCKSRFPTPASKLRLRRLGIYAYQEPVLHLHRDCPVCHSEGSEGQSRVELKLNGRTIVATLNVVNGDFLPSDDGWRVRSGVALAEGVAGRRSLARPPSADRQTPLPPKLVR